MAYPLSTVITESGQILAQIAQAVQASMLVQITGL